VKRKGEVLNEQTIDPAAALTKTKKPCTCSGWRLLIHKTPGGGKKGRTGQKELSGGGQPVRGRGRRVNCGIRLAGKPGFLLIVRIEESRGKIV